MKRRMMATLVSILLATTGHLYAAEEKELAADAVQEAVKVGNKICPISGEPVTSMGEGFPIEHNGKIYILCCAMCAADFKKDPEKYTKIAEDEVKAMTDEVAGEEAESVGEIKK